jgi:hypothetical protein
MGGGWEVADGVDAAVGTDQSPGLHPPIDRASVQPRAPKLSGRDHPVLVGGYPSEYPIRGCDELFSDIEIK